MSAAETQAKTGLANYFVANYPPFSAWKPAYLGDARAALQAPPRPGTPLGLYLHIPFCRKRCKFCYFRVYTDKNARDVETYVEALLKEVELYSLLPIVGGRSLQFVYFGGGTPSYLSAAQLRAQDECSGARQRHGLPDGPAVQHGLFEGAQYGRPAVGGGDRRLADQAGLGRLRVQRDGQGRLRRLQRLHDGQGQGDMPLRL